MSQCLTIPCRTPQEAALDILRVALNTIARTTTDHAAAEIAGKALVVLATLTEVYAPTKADAQHAG